MHSALTAHLEAAVAALVGNGPLKDRLYAAWCEHLDGIATQDLPEETQAEYAAMVKVMHGARALPGDSVVRASIRKFSNDEAARYAALVLRVWRLRIEERALESRAPARTAPAALREATQREATQREVTQREAAPLTALIKLENGGRAGTRAKQAGRS